MISVPMDSVQRDEENPSIFTARFWPEHRRPWWLESPPPPPSFLSLQAVVDVTAPTNQLRSRRPVDLDQQPPSHRSLAGKRSHYHRTSEVIGNHADLSTCIGYSDATCQVIITGLHKKILSWDTRMEKDLLCLVNLGSEVDSMSISGFDIMLAVGTSVYMYDLRNLSRSVQSKKSDMDLRIKCVSSVPYSKGFAAGSVDGRVALEMSFSANSDDITSNFSYTFRCHPKSANKRLHLVSVNDIVFNPLIGSAFFTGDNNGYVSAWNAQSRKRLFELPRYPNSVASLSMNHKGQLLAVASSYTYQEANEIEEPPQIFIKDIGNCSIRSVSSGSSSSH
ncbi:hypothetical protein L484_023014 [Morus notabilis]|uniref:Uncharacterized protein n=1 Tax=Morus notabilis TaxID=981085 RepID=W9S9E9_9ROSA|nr:hypothetical protein L484_023014 [Morus notabilis]